MSNSKMGDAFRAQLGKKPLTPLKGKEVRAALDAKYEASEYDKYLITLHEEALMREWFFYGWQACERSKKP